MSGLSALVILVALSGAGCGGSLQNGSSEESTTPNEDTAVSESLPIPSYDEEPVPAEASDVEPCELTADAPAAEEQIASFRRWLRDQCTGRHLGIEELEPLCGDREGFLVVDVVLNGPAGGLQSLGRALEQYYPGSSWTAGDYERLDGEDVPLRMAVEVRVPTGAQPRPRCTWDDELDCPGDVSDP